MFENNDAPPAIRASYAVLFAVSGAGHAGIAINDTNKLWHPADSFPEPDESNPVIGLDSADEVKREFEAEGRGAARAEEGVA